MKVIAMIDSFKGSATSEELNQSPSQMVEKEQWLRYLLPMEDSINP